MGNCIGGGGQTSTSAQEAHRNVALEQELKNDAVETKKIHKLLLLGPGESGKSTFYKQMTLTRRGGFSAAEREQFAASIRQNLVSYLSEVARGAMGLGFMLEDDHKNFVRECEVVMEKYSELSEIPDFVSRAKALWRHESVQKAWENKSFFQVSDSLEYFMNKIDEVILDAYIPSDDDILRLRARTTGILQEEFSIEGEKFLIVDVGGQRSERRKWFKFFDNVTAVLYVAAIGEYDMVKAPRIPGLMILDYLGRPKDKSDY
jgi:GTPase SAR1 family protein